MERPSLATFSQFVSQKHWKSDIYTLFIERYLTSPEKKTILTLGLFTNAHPDDLTLKSQMDKHPPPHTQIFHSIFKKHPSTSPPHPNLHEQTIKDYLLWGKLLTLRPKRGKKNLRANRLYRRKNMQRNYVTIHETRTRCYKNRNREQRSTWKLKKQIQKLNTRVER